MLKKSDNSGYYLFIVAGVTYTGAEQIFSLDSSFSIIRVDSVPGGVFNFCNTKWISDTKFILTGHVLGSGPGSAYIIKAIVLDTSFSVFHENQFGTITDTSSIPGLRKNLDFSYPNEVYIGGIYVYGEYNNFGSMDTWFFLNHVDTTLELDWQKFYGGDKNYALWGLLATKDSGCLMYGATYDWQKYDYQRDIIAIKVNKHGLLLSSGNPQMDKAKDIIIFPNPGIDKIFIRTMLKSITLSLYDLMGKCVLSKNLQPGLDQLFTGNLPSGIYFYHMWQGNKKVDSGKWIKE